MAALSQSLLPKKTFCIEARAKTTILPSLSKEVPCVFIAQSGNEVSQCFHLLTSINCQYISEVDCKDHCNNIDVQHIQQHLRDASMWLMKRKH